MGQRHKARSVVLQLLYALEIAGPGNLETNLDYCAEQNELAEDGIAFARKLTQVVRDNLDAIDTTLRKHIQNWDIDRLALVDKNILRLGAAEILFFPETPIKVAIDEAIELAKKFSTDKSPAFVNGVLDAILKKIGSA